MSLRRKIMRTHATCDGRPPLSHPTGLKTSSEIRGICKFAPRLVTLHQFLIVPHSSVQYFMHVPSDCHDGYTGALCGQKCPKGTGGKDCQDKVAGFVLAADVFAFLLLRSHHPFWLFFVVSCMSLSSAQISFNATTRQDVGSTRVFASQPKKELPSTAVGRRSPDGNRPKMVTTQGLVVFFFSLKLLH